MNSQKAVLGPSGSLALKQAAGAIAEFDYQVFSAGRIQIQRSLTPKQVHPEEIKAAMRIAGTTPAMLCDELQVAASSVSQTISGHIKSKRIQTRIAEIIGKPIELIWPNQVVLRRSRAQIESQRQSVSARQQRNTSASATAKARAPQRKPGGHPIAEEGSAA